MRDQLLNAGSDHSYLVPTNQLLPASRATKRGVISVSSASDANSSRTNQMTPVHNVIATIHGSQEPGEPKYHLNLFDYYRSLIYFIITWIVELFIRFHRLVLTNSIISYLFTISDNEIDNKGWYLIWKRSIHFNWKSAGRLEFWRTGWRIQRNGCYARNGTRHWSYEAEKR